MPTHADFFLLLDERGRLLSIDWDVTEALADLHAAGARYDCHTVLACVALGVRERTLRLAMPDLPPCPKRAGFRSGWRLVKAGIRVMLRRRKGPPA